jgi:uncharacterized membrane protein
MNKTRLEAFSDGVLAIIITIMVLELRPPHETSWSALKELSPVFMCYLLSFIYVGIYWGNHHHLLHTVKNVTPKIIWANMHLLFWLSLIPFATAWMGENCFQTFPVTVYAVLLCLCAAAYFLLQKTIQKNQRFSTPMLRAMELQSKKGIISFVAYLISAAFAYINPLLSEFIFFLVAFLWIIPDKNIENAIKDHE